MGKKTKPFIVDQNTENWEGWRDPRTGVRLAPGAFQNWPSKNDEAYYTTLKVQGAKVQRSEEIKHSSHR
jgi:hypothetical protein